MQGARPFFWFHGFKGSFTPRISRCARFIAEPRINLRSRRRLCLLLFIFLPILPSLPLLFPLPPFLLLLLFFKLAHWTRSRLSVMLLLLLLPKMPAGSARVSAPSLCVFSPPSPRLCPFFKLLTEDSIKARL